MILKYLSIKASLENKERIFLVRYGNFKLVPELIYRNKEILFNMMANKYN